MPKPLCKTEFTKIYNSYIKHLNEEAPATGVQNAGGPQNPQNLAPANAQTAEGDKANPNAPEVKAATDAVQSLATALQGLKDPKHVQAVTKAIQDMLAKSPASKTPVQPQGAPVSPATSKPQQGAATNPAAGATPGTQPVGVQA